MSWKNYIEIIVIWISEHQIDCECDGQDLKDLKLH